MLEPTRIKNSLVMIASESQLGKKMKVGHPSRKSHYQFQMQPQIFYPPQHQQQPYPPPFNYDHPV
jgi:hypothetical protein